MGHFPFVLVLGSCHLGLDPHGNWRHHEKGNKNLFLPLSPQISEPKPADPQPRTLSYLQTWKACPVPWGGSLSFLSSYLMTSFLSPYLALMPVLTQCLLLSQGPGIFFCWGDPLSLSGGQLKGPSICQSCACWNGPRVWQEGSRWLRSKNQDTNVVFAGVEMGPGRDTLSTQGGVISCWSGEGSVPERVPCGDQ